MISEQTATSTPTRALPVRPVADMALAVEVTSIRSTGWRTRLRVFAEQTKAVTIALLGALASSVRPSFFELERRGPTHQRLGPGLSRESDCFWPLSEW
jgi:hypothetical protein